TILDVGCGTGRVTERLLELVPSGRVLAIDASGDMVDLAAARLRGRARVWRQDVLDLDLDLAVAAILSNAPLHCVGDHDRPSPPPWSSACACRSTTFGSTSPPCARRRRARRGR